MTQSILTTVILCAFFAYGMFTLQRPGFAFHFLSKFWKALLPKWLHEPFFACGVCVSSVWGGGLYLWLMSLGHYSSTRALVADLVKLPVVAICAACICAVIDRAVKAFEKTYGYTPPQPQKKGEAKWSYLLPYDELRQVLVTHFVEDWFKKHCDVLEIGGFHHDFSQNPRYFSFNHTKPFNEHQLAVYMGRNKKYAPYCVLILGLAYEGNLRDLKKLIQHAYCAVIEYSDDGISRQQIELLTEGIKTKSVIPEYFIEDGGKAPAACGQAARRKLLVLYP